jgi:putative phage-type endonuclease
MPEIIQGSAEWFAARLGKVTASRVADVVAKTKSGPSASRNTYMAQLIAERLTGTTQDSFSNAAMQWGTEKEPEARAAYEFFRNETVTEIGFVCHPHIDDCGASPDGLVGADGLLEIKCPNTATHLDTLLGKMVPAKYVNQIQWQLSCTGRAWCDFASYDPRLPERMRLFVKRMPRDEKRIVELETEVAAFLLEMDGRLAELNNIYNQEAA